MNNMHSFNTRQEAAEKLAKDVAGWLLSAVKAKGNASLVVSGGSTPKPFFKALGAMDLPWDQIYVTLADERWVSPASEDSNEKLVRENMTRLKQFVPLKNAATTPAQGEQEAETAIKLLLPFDVVILGMGDDGHTASLFPHHPGLTEGLKKDSQKICLGIEDSPKPPPSRMTLTYAALVNCTHMALHISGQDKLQVLEKASENDNIKELPIRPFLQQAHVPVSIYWAA